MAIKAKLSRLKRVARLKVPKRIHARLCGLVNRDAVRHPVETTKRATEQLTDRVLTLAFTAAAEALTQSLRDHRIERELATRDAYRELSSRRPRRRTP